MKTEASVNRWSFILGIIVFGFFSIYFIYRSCDDLRNESLLKNTAETTAIIIEIHKPEVVRGSYYCIFRYRVGKDNFEVKELGDFSYLELGDTILVEYAIEDNSVAKVKDRYYMGKYHHFKNH